MTKKSLYNKWLVLIGKKNVEYFIKDGVIVTVTTTGLFFALKAAGIKPPQAAMDAMDVMKLGARICAGVLVKDYGVYKKWMNE